MSDEKKNHGIEVGQRWLSRKDWAVATVTEIEDDIVRGTFDFNHHGAAGFKHSIASFLERYTREPVFYKYRHKFNSGPSEWQYVEAGPRDPVEEISNDLRELHELRYPDAYRGIDIERVDSPPPEWIQERLVEAQSTLNLATRQILRYTHMLVLLERKERKQ